MATNNGNSDKGYGKMTNRRSYNALLEIAARAIVEASKAHRLVQDYDSAVEETIGDVRNIIDGPRLGVVLSSKELADLQAYNEKMNLGDGPITICHNEDGDVVAGFCDEDFWEGTTYMIRKAN